MGDITFMVLRCFPTHLRPLTVAPCLRAYLQSLTLAFYFTASMLSATTMPSAVRTTTP